MARKDIPSSMSEEQFLQQFADNTNQQNYNQSLQKQAYPQGMRPNPVIQRAQQAQQLSPQAQAHFSRQAIYCEVCGGTGVGDSKEWGDWERKWSLHRTCAEAVWNQLDRRSGMATQRQQNQPK